MQASSYTEAKIRGLSKYFTGKPCRYGHLSEKYTGSRTCVECANLKAAARTKASKEKDPELHKKKLQDYWIKYSTENAEKVDASRKRWVQNNPDKVKASARKTFEKRYAADKAYYRALHASYRAAKLKRTPPWSDLNRIREIYRERERISLETGIVHHVDHEIPLKGEFVSGLHVPDNLRIIPAEENLKKSNKFKMEKH